jgi:paraquat-inducible protein A
MPLRIDSIYVAELENNVQLACFECDLLLSLRPLQEGDHAICPRCGFVISSRSRDGLARAMAFAISGAVLLALANSFPFLALKAGGLESVMTLPRTAIDLYDDGYGLLAALVLTFIVFVPGAMIGLIALLTASLSRGRSSPWLAPAARLLTALSTWSMAEVFVIGVIVSLVKIAQLATVVIGLSFWAYVAFAICFTAAVASLDRQEIWDAIERQSV